MTQFNNDAFREYELSEDYEKHLLESSDPIEKLIMKFRNNFDLLLKLIDIIESSKVKKQEVDSFVEMLTHNFFENNLIQNNEQEEILILIFFLLEREISKMSTPLICNFINENSFLGRILKTYSKRPEVKAYISLVLTDTIIKIDNLNDNSLELDPKKIIAHLSSKKRKKSTMKNFNILSSKSLINSLDMSKKHESNKSLINNSYKSTGVYSQLSPLDNLSLIEKSGIDIKEKEFEGQSEDSELTQKDLFSRIDKQQSNELKDFCNFNLK